MKQLLFLSIAVMLFSSCEKMFENEGWERDRDIEVIEISQDIYVQVNDTYTFTLPIDAEGDFQILEDAQNAQLSEIGIDNEENPIYTYTPNTAFSGTDEVVLSNVEDEGCGFNYGGRGSCGDDQAEERGKFYNIRLSVEVGEDPGDN